MFKQIGQFSVSSPLILALTTGSSTGLAINSASQGQAWIRKIKLKTKSLLKFICSHPKLKQRMNFLIHKVLLLTLTANLLTVVVQ
jgi:hypothetical protein